MDVNVKAPFLLTKALVPNMENRPGDKSIVYISSFAGYQMMPLLATYSLSKTALIGLSRIVAVDCMLLLIFLFVNIVFMKIFVH